VVPVDRLGMTSYYRPIVT